MTVLANDGISENAIIELEKAEIKFINQRVASEHLASFINENIVDVLLVSGKTKARKDLIEACPSLKIIGHSGSGIDNIDVAFAKEKGIKVINTPTSSSKSIAELVFGHFLTMARFLHESNRLMPLEGDTRFNDLKKDFKNAFKLSGKTLGVIGFGSIGQEVVKIGIALGMKVKVCTRQPKTENIELSFFDGQRVNFTITSTNNTGEFLEDCDFISINTPKTTEYILSSSEFKKMKNGVFIANTTSAGVLDEVAMINYIENKKNCWRGTRCY